MRSLKFLLQKEFRQIFRNRSILMLIFVMPVVQLLILPLAADYEIKNINISIVDHDNSEYSQRLIDKIDASHYFKITSTESAFRQAFRELEQDKSDLILEIPEGFARNLVRENKQTLFIGVNAINGVKANLGGVYLSQIIGSFNYNIRAEWILQPRLNPLPVIEISSANWFNPSLNYRTFMVPGILALLVTMVGSFMCSLNIVKEKEIGTMEQVNVTPIKKYQFILGKLIPFWIIGIFVFSVGLFGIAWLVYGIVPVGNLWLLYGYLLVYLMAVLGLGLLISTYADTQQQAMSITFFVMMIFILMSGLFTPIDGMPGWAYVISQMSPITYFIEVLRMVVLKGSTFNDITHQFIVTAGFAILFNSWAIFNYKKTN